MGLYRHYSLLEIPPGMWKACWPNFTPAELSCPCCGEYWHDGAYLDKLQAARTAAGFPFTINSAHRCEIHNAVVGGVPLSEHLKMATDISVQGRDRREIKRRLGEAGLSTFGHYQTFLHTDPRPHRAWYSGPKARELWI